MPYETLTVSLKPADFFTSNPALDVPPSDPAFNRSKLYEDAVMDSHPNGTASCCRT